MRYLVAVSGGIDSVVLLNMLVDEVRHELIVAHFDHGIRPDSVSDARFVEGLAAVYHLPFIVKREELGPNASEDMARARRYAFLNAEAKKANATLVTAHHADDVVETIAVNSIRGTGWRGLAVLDAPNVVRPLFHMTKSTIRTYAQTKRLEWVEDSTNATDAYLRNRIRRQIALSMPSDDKQAMLNMWMRQVKLKAKIDEELTWFVHENGEYARYFFIQSDKTTATEVLRAAIVARAGGGSTRPQVERGLLAIKTAKPNTICELGARVHLRFTAHTFIVETP